MTTVKDMMTSSNGNIFRVTGHLCGEFTGPGEFPTQRPVTRSFDVFFDLRLNKQLSKQSWCWWFETLSRPLWRHCNECLRENVIWYFKTQQHDGPNLLYEVEQQENVAHYNINVLVSLSGIYHWYYFVDRVARGKTHPLSKNVYIFLYKIRWELAMGVNYSSVSWVNNMMDIHSLKEWINHKFKNSKILFLALLPHTWGKTPFSLGQIALRRRFAPPQKASCPL